MRKKLILATLTAFVSICAHAEVTTVDDSGTLISVTAQSGLQNEFDIICDELLQKQRTLVEESIKDQADQFCGNISLRAIRTSKVEYKSRCTSGCGITHGFTSAEATFICMQ
jgi:hypothetical protein